MHATAVMSAYALVFMTTLTFSMCEGRVLCTPCTNRVECDTAPLEVCVWGETRDSCGRRACAKGPGERCGGTFNVLGTCGEGMMCTTGFLDKNVERCHGCSTFERIECFP